MSVKWSKSEVIKRMEAAISYGTENTTSAQDVLAPLLKKGK